MDFQISINSKQFDVEQSHDEIKVNGKPVDYEIHTLSPSRLLIISSNKAYDVDVIEKIGKQCVVKVNHNILKLDIHTKLDQLLDQLGMSNNLETVTTEILSPMPGTILDILIKEGQDVEKGEPLMILEAMKMENIIKSPEHRTVKKIGIQKGDNVNKGDNLVSFE